MAAPVSCSLLIAVLLCLTNGPVTGAIDLDKELLQTKPGMCPKTNVTDVLGECVEMCSRDSDCLNNQKCCSNGCGHQCMPPYKEKPGVCPSNSLIRCVRFESLCSHDGNCPDNKKCCTDGCGNHCMPPYKAKPGVCPKVFPGVGKCEKLCVDDTDCLDDVKCCKTTCGLECTPPRSLRG